MKKEKEVNLESWTIIAQGPQLQSPNSKRAQVQWLSLKQTLDELIYGNDAKTHFECYHMLPMKHTHTHTHPTMTMQKLATNQHYHLLKTK